MKRTRTQALGPYKNRPFKRPRQAQPKRTYTGSRVPLASRGYRLNPIEKKVFDVVTTIYPANTTGSVTSMYQPTLGTDFTNRVGRKTTIKSIQARGIVRVRLAESMASGVTSPQLIRWMMILDTQPNGALPAVTDILAASLPQSPLNLNNRDRFKVIIDKQWVLDPYEKSTTATQAIVSTTNQCRALKVYRKCNIETIFNATNGGSVADITSGAIIQLLIGNQPTDGAGGPGEAAIQTRIRFQDM